MSSTTGSAADIPSYGRLGFGSANAGNLYTAISDDAAHLLFQEAWDCGLRHYDTAPHYGIGLAEERLGAFLSAQPRAEYHLSTKVGRILVPNEDFRGEPDPFDHFDVPATRRRIVDYSASGVRRSLEGSLERMGVGRVDTLYIHDPEHLGAEHTRANLEAALPGAIALREEGLVTSVGVGTGSVDAAQTALEIGGLDIIMLAGRLTLLEQPAYPRLVSTCAEQGVGIVNTAQFNSGLLATASPSSRSTYEYQAAPQDKLDRAVALAKICQSHGVELPAAALQYGFQHAPVVAVVMGAATPEQVRQNAERMDQRVPEELWADLRQQGLIP